MSIRAGLGAYALFTADTSLWLVGAALFLQGVGMASIMPPATELIMSALPREKAGVGSAVSNTMRQIAGALGLATGGRDHHEEERGDPWEGSFHEGAPVESGVEGEVLPF